MNNLALLKTSTLVSCHPEPRRRRGTSRRPTVTLLRDECDHNRMGGPSSSARFGMTRIYHRQAFSNVLIRLKAYTEGSDGNPALNAGLM